MRRTIEIDGLPVTVYDRGRGRPIVFLHGATQDRTVWARQVAWFRHSSRTISFDMRGHGRTPLGWDDGDDRQILTMERLGTDCLAVMDALGIERAVLCGVSLGGMVALNVAARSPDRVTALVLANTPLALSLNRRLLALIDWLGPYRLLVPLLRVFDGRRIARAGLWLAGVVLGPGWARGKATVRFVEAFARMSPEALVETYRAICEARLPPLGEIDAPVLVVTGTDEAGVIFRHAAEIARGVGTAELATIPGGHVSNLDSPDAFNEALENFFRRWLDQSSSTLRDAVAVPDASPRKMPSASAGSIRPS